MIEILIITGMLIAFSLGAYTGIKAVQMGLKFKVQVDKNIEPRMDEPVKEFFERKEQKNQVNQTTQMISDILGGE